MPSVRSGANNPAGLRSRFLSVWACARACGIIINPAGWSFTSIAILDALKTFEGPVIELHISNIHARDKAHRHSVLSQGVTAVIAGLGARGYPIAVTALIGLMDQDASPKSP